MTIVPENAPVAGGGTRIRARPFGILVLAALFIVRALLLLVALAGPSLPDLGPVGRLFAMPAEIAASIRETPVLAWVVGGLVLVLVSAAVLLWFGRRAGWLIGILTTGFFLVLDLYQASSGDMHVIWMTLDVVVVFYLNQRDVRDHFSVRDSGPLP